MVGQCRPGLSRAAGEGAPRRGRHRRRRRHGDAAGRGPARRRRAAGAAQHPANGRASRCSSPGAEARDRRGGVPGAYRQRHQPAARRHQAALARRHEPESLRRARRLCRRLRLHRRAADRSSIARAQLGAGVGLLDLAPRRPRGRPRGARAASSAHCCRRCATVMHVVGEITKVRRRIPGFGRHARGRRLRRPHRLGLRRRRHRHGRLPAQVRRGRRHHALGRTPARPAPVPRLSTSCPACSCRMAAWRRPAAS